MTDLKPLSAAAVPAAIERAEHYRALNEPTEAESVCRDILRVDPDNQRAAVLLILALTDQFSRGVPVTEASERAAALTDEYERRYYQGLIYEREAKAQIARGVPGSEASAYEWLRRAMEAYESAESIRPAGNDDTILRWNACARILRNRAIGPRATDAFEPPIE